ncbi:MAG: YdbH domain-containing protein [Rhodospirillales bacterium]|nr:YdbH domain-containing protein [Alphaproteobacteria bacterium]MCB1840257.1 YdbH domain-containing protein [Alphaproteobacteria bacterium]MCB9975984.1 YdbH domain-containing protein [Rhodospirillales bacterium]
MFKFVKFIALLGFLLTGVYYFALYWYIPGRIKDRFSQGLQNIGFEKVEFKSIEAEGGAVIFKNISLDPKSFSGVEELEIHYSPFSYLLFGGQADSITIRKLQLTGELSESYNLTLAGWKKDPGFLKVLGFIPAPVVFVEGAVLDVMHPKLGGLKLEFEGQVRKKSGSSGNVELLGRIRSTQKKLSFESTATGTVTADGSLDAEVKADQFQLELDDYKLNRSSGTAKISIPFGQGAQVHFEAVVPSMVWSSFPLGDTKLLLDIAPDQWSINSEGKTSGAESIPFSAKFKSAAENKTSSEIKITPESFALLSNFLIKNSLLTFGQPIPQLLDKLKNPSVTFSYSEDPAKTESGPLKGQWNVDDADHTVALQGAFVFDSGKKVLSALCEKAKFKYLENFAKGTSVDVSCSLTWDGWMSSPVAKWDINADIKGFSLNFGPLRIGNIRGKIADNAEAETKKTQSVDFNFDLPLKSSIKYQGRIRFELEPPERANIETSSLFIYGGSIRTDKVPLPDFLFPDTLTLKVSDISLRQFFSDTNLPTFKIEGRMGGVIPLLKEGGALTIKDALLQSQDPGSIMLPESISKTLFPGDEPEMKAIRDALKNYHYEYFEFRLDGSLSEGVLMTLKSRGTNPDFKDKRPIEINLQIDTQVMFLIEHMLSTSAYKSLEN